MPEHPLRYPTLITVFTIEKGFWYELIVPLIVLMPDEFVLSLIGKVN